MRFWIRRRCSGSWIWCQSSLSAVLSSCSLSSFPVCENFCCGEEGEGEGEGEAGLGEEGEKDLLDVEERVWVWVWEWEWEWEEEDEVNEECRDEREDMLCLGGG